METKSCPFCDSDYQSVAECEITGNHYVLCDECNCRGPLVYCHTKEKAVAAWNERAGEENE